MGRNFINKILSSHLVLVLCCLLAACGDRGLDADKEAGTGRVALRVAYVREGAPKTASVQAVERMVATLRREGADAVSLELERAGSRWQGVFEAEAGDYTVGLEAFKEGEVRWRGAAPVAVRAGREVPVDISMERLYLLQASVEALNLGADGTEGLIEIENGGVGENMPWRMETDAEWLGLANVVDGGVGAGGEPVNSIVTGQLVGREDKDRQRVVVSREGLEAGTYRSQVRISSSGGDLVIPVSLIVEPPELRVLPFEFGVGEALNEQTVVLENIGKSELSWTVSEEATWLDVIWEGNTTADGPLSGTGAARLTVRTLGAGLAAGTYAARVQVESNGGSATVEVILIVEAQPMLRVTPLERTVGSVQTVQVNNDGGGTLLWSVSEDVGWLDLVWRGASTADGPLSGEGRAELTLLTDSVGLASGVHIARVRFTSNGGDSGIEVRLTVEAEQPVLRVEPLAFEVGEGFNEETVAIDNVGAGELAWTVSEDQTWLDVFWQGNSTAAGPLGGAGPAQLALRTLGTGLAAGTYTAQVQIESNGGSATVEVTLTVEGAQPVLRVAPLAFSAGGGFEEQVLLVDNAGAGDLLWSVSEDIAWLDLVWRGASTADGPLSGEGSAQLFLRTDGTGLTAGGHSARMVFTSNGGQAEVAVNLQADGPLPEAEADLTAYLPDGVRMDFVWIEPGVFLMGAPEGEAGRSLNEGPLHEVEIGSGFYLGVTEVTQAQWEVVMGANPSRFLGADFPVETVSWFEAQDFVGRLNAAAGDSLYRLPSEAEWEYACRAGTTTPWSFGSDEDLLERYAWYQGNNDPAGTKAVASRLPNPWGLFDMHGNVWEWVQDRFDSEYYAVAPRRDPQGPDSGGERVMRGGAYNQGAAFLRSADRLRFAPEVRGPNVGLRLVRVRD